MNFTPHFTSFIYQIEVLILRFNLTFAKLLKFPTKNSPQTTADSASDAF